MRMCTRPPRLYALCAAFALAGCASGDMGKSATSATSAVTATPVQMVYPDGIVTTAEALRSTRGIYAVAAGSAERCCWADRDVRFFVRVPPGAKALGIDVTMPAVAAFGGKKQTVTSLDPSGKSVATRSVPLGTSAPLTFPVPAGASRDRVVPVHLRMSVSVVPHDVGAGPDVRRLAVIITAASAR